MASGGSRCKTGIVTGTGSDMSVEGVGFRPRRVQLINIDGNSRADWGEQMPDDAMAKIVDSGAGATDLSYVTTDGVTPSHDGFDLGADTDLNVSGEQVMWTCWD